MDSFKVTTVRGPVDAATLGFTLTHEHFSLDFHHFYAAAPVDLQSYVDKKINLQNVGYIRQYPYSSRYNINFNDDDTHEAVLKDVISYKKFGGCTIVENTSHGLNRNLKVMLDISEASGVNIIAGTGHYVHGVQPDSVLNMTIEEMSDLYTKDILFGTAVERPGKTSVNVNCGIIGEVGSSWPITSFERKAIQATAETQSILKCPVTFHSGRDSEAPFEIVRLYLEAGGKAEKCVMSHLDRTLLKSSQLLEFAKLGTYCQFDLFGTECSYYQLNPSSYMLSDEQRLQYILELLGEGYENRILLSHDIHTKHRLTSFGGHGYSHILTNILMRLSLKGVDEKTINTITVENPGRWLSVPL
ncbi:phosphotriesterase-related protein [Malaya genurostris]|uniref:phosphotriesterase-related protein n=1 Tax=Malaya genurostris TaxID=325434 RepID=UPI0026F3876E|nr:phosphotriesterase-related protein [Malaya genurostris]XP_058444802.1 phosphotriesterase-related protein [Malaya genurostris]